MLCLMLLQLVWRRFFCVLCNTAWKAWTESWKWNKSVNVNPIVQSTQWSWKSINTKHVLHISIWISSCHSAMVTYHKNVCFQQKNYELWRLESYSAICVQENNFSLPYKWPREASYWKVMVFILHLQSNFSILPEGASCHLVKGLEI